jgi:hypothetical protein
VTTTLERDVRFLKRYCLVSTILIAIGLLTAFSALRGPAKFEEIDVERINVVESDGKLRMVISNEARQHPGIMNGKLNVRSGPRPPGMIFFDQTGDEMGGLIFGENGGRGHFGSLTFDKARGDQTIGFRHLESDNGSYSSSLELWQQPKISGDVQRSKYDSILALPDSVDRRKALDVMRAANEVTTPRLFLGKGRDDVSTLVLSDMRGQPRLRLSVSPDGAPRIELLDENGHVTKKITN